MIDPELLRENPELVKAACKNKNVTIDVDAILALDVKKRELAGQIDEINRARKAAAETKDVEHGRALKQSAAEAEKELSVIDAELAPMLLKLPNIPSDDTPIGADESANVVLRQVGDKPQFDFAPKDHVVLGEALGFIDIEKAAQVVGARFAYMKGDLVLLEMAVINFAVNFLTNEGALKHLIEIKNLNVSSKPFTLFRRH